MGEIKEIIRCYSCGTILQSDDKNKIGYIDKDILESESQSFFFCNSCFEKERHQKPAKEPTVTNDLLTILKDAKKKKALFVYVINVFSFEASFSSKVNELLKGEDILVLANKADLLAKNSDLDNIKKYIAHQFLISGLRIKKDNILFVSLFDEMTTKAVLDNLYERKGERDIYLVGTRLSGKTTMTYSMLRFYSNKSNESIVTKTYPGTKIKVMRIPLGKNSAVYNTPSIDDDNSLLHNLDRYVTSVVDILKPFRPTKINLGIKHSLFVGGLAMIEVINERKVTLTCYVSPKISLLRTSNLKSDEKFIKAIEKRTVKPVLKFAKTIKDFDVYEVDVDDNGIKDIGIEGLGWFTFKADNQAFRIFVPHGVAIYLSSTKVLLKNKK